MLIRTSIRFLFVITKGLTYAYHFFTIGYVLLSIVLIVVKNKNDRKEGFMKKVLNALLILIWVIDILNIGTSIFGFNLVEFLDITFPINGLAWLLIWLLVI